MKLYKFNDIEYTFLKGDESIFNYDSLKELVTDYFEDFDYIFVDESYNKLRLKGFYDKENKKVKDLNNIKNLDKYITNYCAYGCKWFILQKKKK